jgi:hypothetical protein
MPSARSIKMSWLGMAPLRPATGSACNFAERGVNAVRLFFETAPPSGVIVAMTPLLRASSASAGRGLLPALHCRLRHLRIPVSIAQPATVRQPLYENLYGDMMLLDQSKANQGELNAACYPILRLFAHSVNCRQMRQGTPADWATAKCH